MKKKLLKMWTEKVHPKLKLVGIITVEVMKIGLRVGVVAAVLPFLAIGFTLNVLRSGFMAGWELLDEL